MLVERWPRSFRGANRANPTTTIPTFSFVQTFKYDAIKRLSEAVETTGTTQNWKQTFGYDRFGNRTSFYQIVGSTELPTNNLTRPTVDPANNQFTTGQGYVYDLNGNLVQDAQGRSFTFNGDDKQTEVRDTSTNALIGQYFYDGSGARVKKFVPGTGETTVFVYDAGGALAAEYSTIVAPVQEATTSYLTTDHLGSPRVITDASGGVIARRDFMPFGEELGVGVGSRSESLKYSNTDTDQIRKRFTGYEKDDETALDFAEARMYQNKHGRFTAPDPLLASASAVNPQTFNRYTYTGNNPINYTDPSGLNWCRRLKDGATDFTGIGVACENGWEDIDNRVVEVSRGNFNRESTNGPAGVRSIILMNPNGTVTVQQAAPDVVALAQGRSVQETVEVTGGESATSVAAASASTSFGLVNTSITPRPLDALPPCAVCVGDGSTPWSNPLAEIASSAPPLKTPELIARAFEGCSLIPGIGSACAVGATATRFGQGRFGEAGDNFLNIVPFLGIARKADKAANTAKAADDVVEGIYEFVSSNGKVYVGQSSNIPARIKQHLASGKLLPEALDTVTSKTVLGGKTAREIAEQLRIRDLGGIKNLRNERNPIGKARKYLLKGL